MTWAEVGIAAAICSFLSFLLGGAGFSLGLRRFQSVVFSPFLFCFVIAACSLASPLVGWNIVVVFAGFAAFFVLAIAARSLLAKQSPVTLVTQQAKSYASPISHENQKLLIWAGVAVFINFTVVVVLIALSCGTPQTILQNYDSAFHCSVVRHIVETSNASPIGAGYVMGNESSIYPDLWHAICALICTSGVNEMMPSVWIAIIVVVGFFAPVCLCGLVRALMDRPSSLVMFLCMLSPVVIRYSVFQFIPFGPLLSNMLGLSLLPAATAWFAFEFQMGRLVQKIWRKALIVLICVFTVGMAHPNTVFILLVLALCLMWARVKNLWVRFAWIGLGAGVWAICFHSSLFMRTINCPDRIAGDIGYGELLFGKLHLSYATFSEYFALSALLALGVFAAFCACAFLLRKIMKESWFIAAVGFFAAEAVLSLFPTSPVSIALTAFFYRDFYRFVVIFCYLATPALIMFCASATRAAAAKLGAASDDGALNTELGAAHCPPAVKALAVCGLAVFFAIGVHEDMVLQESLASVTKDAGSWKDITAAQEEFSQEVADIVDDAGVLNNANDGSVFLYSIYGVNAALKGRPANQIDSMSDDLCLVIENIDKVGEGAAGEDAADETSAESSEVRAALNRLGIEYVVKMTDSPNMTIKMNDLKQIEYTSSDAICAVNAETPGFTLVLERDGMQLLRIDE